MVYRDHVNRACTGRARKCSCGQRDFAVFEGTSPTRRLGTGLRQLTQAKSHFREIELLGPPRRFQAYLTAPLAAKVTVLPVAAVQVLLATVSTNTYSPMTDAGVAVTSR